MGLEVPSLPDLSAAACHALACQYGSSFVGDSVILPSISLLVYK